MPLSEQQQRALEAFDWLCDPNARRTGRTYLLVVAAIRAACRNPGQRIGLIEHHYPGHVRSGLVELARGLVQADPSIRGHLRFSPSGEITASLFRPIPNWLPVTTEVEVPADAYREEDMMVRPDTFTMPPIEQAALPQEDQQAIARIEAALASLKPKPKKPRKPKPVIRTVLDRLLADDDD